MDAAELYHFLFETMPGIGVLIGIGLVLSILICIFWEWRTKRKFRDRPAEDDFWALDEEDYDEEEKE